MGLSKYAVNDAVIVFCRFNSVCYIDSIHIQDSGEIKYALRTFSGYKITNTSQDGSILPLLVSEQDLIAPGYTTGGGHQIIKQFQSLIESLEFKAGSE